MNIGKFAIVLVIILVASGILGAIFTWGSGMYDNNNGWTDTQIIDQQESASMLAVHTVTLEAVSTDIEFIPYDGETIEFNYTGETTYRALGDKIVETPTLIIEESDGVLAARIQYPQNRWRIIDFGGNDDLIIHVPAHYGAALSIETVSGDVLVGDFDLTDLKISAVSSDMESLAVVDNLFIESVSGSVESALATYAEVTMVSGDVDIALAGKGLIETVSGDVTLDLEDGASYNFDTVSGDFESSASLVSGNDVLIDTVSGDLEII